MDVRDAAAEYRIEPVPTVDADDVSPGYKRTEVGVIPEDWGIQRLGLLCNIKAAGDLVKSEYSENQDADHQYPIYSNAVTGEGLYGYSSSCQYGADSVTVTARGEIGYAAYRRGDFSAIGRLLVLSPTRQVAMRLVAECINNLIEFALESTGVPQLTAPQIAGHWIPLPSSIAEQQAIAKALSDADALIESLQQLIAKQRALKQGAMQALLTGRQRLPGYTGEWQTKRLGDIAHIKTGSRNNQDKVENGAYPFFVRSESVERIDSYSYACEAILVPGEGKIGEIFHYINGRFDVHQRVYAITQFAPNVSGRYVHLYMSVRFGTHAMENSVKATVDSLRLPTFQEFEINLPPTIEEQTAIATVLSDMDAEIEALEARLAKTRALKAGMMQQLLTGRIRLV